MSESKTIKVSDLILLHEARQGDFGLTWASRNFSPDGYYVDLYESFYEYDDLEGVIFNIYVECVDDHGNINTKIESLVFDFEQDITLIYPIYI